MPHPPEPTSDPVLKKLLSSLTPTDRQTLLLRACLHSGAPAVTAWQTWQAQAGEPKRAFAEDKSGLKGLLPLLQSALQRNDVSVDKVFQTYLRTARAREELRANIFYDVLGQVLRSFESSDVPVIALKGSALSETVYEHKTVRHNHAIDLLVDEQHLASASAIIPTLKFRRLGQPNGPGRQHVMFKHNSRLPLGLHTRLFYLPHYQAPLAEIWDRSVPCDIAGVKTRVLSPADNLFHICGHASYSRSRSRLRWACDAWKVLAHHPDLDWSVFLDCVEKHRFALPLHAILRYLANELDAPVPTHVLGSLKEAAQNPSALEKEALYAAAAHNLGSISQLLRQFADGPGTSARLLKFALLPSPTYMRWRYDIPNPYLVPALYLYRPFRFMTRRISGQASIVSADTSSRTTGPDRA